MMEEEFDQEEFIEKGERVFEWNEHGVCENEKLMTFKCSRKYTAQVRWAKNRNNLWVYGMSFNGYNQGCSEPVIDDSNGYATEDEAYNASVNRLIDFISNNNYHCKYDAILRMLSDELPNDDNKLTLF